ncbi:hypothetical protein [Actinomadura rubrisoli]|uniref:Uncharacterized protein n=1 Tax=Actinomadura rubrisoli TaxID=2530368 RepID=A0A4R5AWW4_9ACTN|nr:hypothetical protein [Actinomadura rubrisoli]TDD75674.1 hypothetical protein E1298_31480 [Actinomadura rubrisoli]
MGLGVRDGVRDGVGVGEGRLVVFVPEGDGEPLDGLPDGVVDGEVVEEAGVDARDCEEVVFISAGIAISAPMTKNTAAMTTLGNCIAFLLGPPGRGPGGWRMILDHS